MTKALFLGAGFSYDLGMPLVWELTKEFKKIITPKILFDINEKRKAFDTEFKEETVAKVTDLLNRSDIHYEQLIGALEVEMNRFENRNLRQDFHGINEWFKELISNIFYLRHINASQIIDKQIELHKGFKSLIIAGEPLWVFSLNHDLIIELIAAKFGILLKTGFPQDNIEEVYVDEKRTKKIRFGRLIFKDANSYPFDYLANGTTGINLFKIHGSLDFFGYDDLKSYLSFLPEELSTTGYLDVLKKLEQSVSLNLPKTTNEIIVYDQKGVIQFLRRSILSGIYKFDKRASQIVPYQMLDYFKSNLNYASELIVIGYGFGDIHINIVLRDWLSLTSKRSIVIVSPDLIKVPEFIGHLGSQVTLIKKKAIEYLIDLPAGKLSSEENNFYKISQFVRDEKNKEIVELLIKLRPQKS